MLQGITLSLILKIASQITTRCQINKLQGRRINRVVARGPSLSVTSWMKVFYWLWIEIMKMQRAAPSVLAAPCTEQQWPSVLSGYCSKRVSANSPQHLVLPCTRRASSSAPAILQALQQLELGTLSSSLDGTLPAAGARGSSRILAVLSLSSPSSLPLSTLSAPSLQTPLLLTVLGANSPCCLLWCLSRST